MTSRGLPIAATADAARNGIRPEARREARGVVAKWPTQERRKRHDDDCDPHLILEASSTGGPSPSSLPPIIYKLMRR